MNNEIIVMGNSRAWGGDLVIGHAEMKDAIDGAAVRQALRDVGCCENDLPTVDELGRVVNVFAKAEASRTVRFVTAATRCWTIRTLTARAMRERSSMQLSLRSWEIPWFMSPAAPSIRARRWRSRCSYRAHSLIEEGYLCQTCRRCNRWKCASH
jgi:hypothetical protein